MLVAMSVFGWLAWTSLKEPGHGEVAGARPSNTAASAIPDERFQLLAGFQAPDYMPEPGGSKSFHAAMASYQNKDYANAASRLRTITIAKPGFVEARFYLGISLLLSGNRIAGIQELRTVTMAATGPYLEQARFYLAKGLIAEHDITRAEQQLQAVIAQHGDLETQATVLLGQIEHS